MVLSLVAIVGWVFAVAAAFYAVVVMKKSEAYQASILDLSSKIEIQAQSFEKLKLQVEESKSAVQSKEASIAKLKKSNSSQQERINSLEEDLELERARYGGVDELWQGKVENYEAQIKALTNQLAELNEEKRHFKDDARKTAEEKLFTIQEQLRSLETENKTLKDESSVRAGEKSKLAKELEKKEKLIAAIDPKEYARTKRRIKQYNQLLHVAKSQRQLMEEQNANLTTALRKTSSWILSQKRPGSRTPTNLGQLLGEALEAIEANLVEDELSLFGTKAPKTLESYSEVPIQATTPTADSTYETGAL